MGGSIREELVGFCTLAVMALLGMALYSGTYSLVYASIGVNEPTVAILEMWMTFVHLFAAVACCVLQGLYAGLLKQRNSVLPHLAEAQTSLFLGVACAVTILGNNCLQHGECAAYYGAASFPRLAAAGSMAWVWVMYATSLGCQSWSKGVTLGFNDKQGLTAAAAMLMLPCTVNAKLSTTCGWSELEGDSVTPILVIFGGLLLCHGGNSFAGSSHKNNTAAVVVRVIGCLIFMCAFMLVPTQLWGAYNFTALVLAGNGLLAEIWKGKPRGFASKATAHNAAAGGVMGGALSSLKHKITSTFAHNGKRRGGKEHA
jgi:hypothetical protein